jgi:hypothetical protein
MELEFRAYALETGLNPAERMILMKIAAHSSQMLYVFHPSDIPHIAKQLEVQQRVIWSTLDTLERKGKLKRMSAIEIRIARSVMDDFEGDCMWRLFPGEPSFYEIEQAHLAEARAAKKAAKLAKKGAAA